MAVSIVTSGSNFDDTGSAYNVSIVSSQAGDLVLLWGLNTSSPSINGSGMSILLTDNTTLNGQTNTLYWSVITAAATQVAISNGAVVSAAEVVVLRGASTTAPVFSSDAVINVSSSILFPTINATTTGGCGLHFHREFKAVNPNGSYTIPDAYQFSVADSSLAAYLHTIEYLLNPPTGVDSPVARTLSRSAYQLNVSMFVAPAQTYTAAPLFFGTNA